MIQFALVLHNAIKSLAFVEMQEIKHSCSLVLFSILTQSKKYNLPFLVAQYKYLKSTEEINEIIDEDPRNDCKVRSFFDSQIS